MYGSHYKLLQITPPILCGISTQYLTNEVMGPAGAESLLKYVKFDIMESILSSSSFFLFAGGNLHTGTISKIAFFHIPTTTTTTTAT